MYRDARKRPKSDLNKDPFADMDWPRESQPKPDPFTDEERDKILSYFKEKNPFYYPIYSVLDRDAPVGSVSPQMGDIDLKAGKASITKSWYYGAENPTKTEASEREASLLPPVVDVLKAVKPLHVTESDHVFKNRLGNPINEDKWRKKHWFNALRLLSIRERKFYATRHTYISVALRAGVNTKWLAEQCGTSVAMIEKHYGRYIKDDGDAPLRDLLGAKSETLGETLSTVTRGIRRQEVGNSREERWSGRLDLNQRLHGPEPCALPS